VAGRQSPREPDLTRWMCQRGRKPKEGCGKLKGGPHSVVRAMALKGGEIRREVRRRILNHRPATVGWEDLPAGPKGNGVLGSQKQ